MQGSAFADSVGDPGIWVGCVQPALHVLNRLIRFQRMSFGFRSKLRSLRIVF